MNEKEYCQEGKFNLEFVKSKNGEGFGGERDDLLGAKKVTGEIYPDLF